MRSTPEWVGASDDSRIPPRVRLRVFYRDSGICQCGCGLMIRAGQKWQTDHIVALINGGKNVESNLRTLLAKHHAEKTKADVAEKAKVYRKAAAHLGIKPKSSRPFPGSRASGLKKLMSGEVVRRSSLAEKDA